MVYKIKDVSRVKETASVCKAGEYDTGIAQVMNDKIILRTKRSISHERLSGVYDWIR